MSASALLINRSTRSRSSESLRLACTHRRLRNRWSSRGLGTGATPLLARSMRTTSAPRSPRTIAAWGPGPMPASSTTRNPCSGPVIATASSLRWCDCLVSAGTDPLSSLNNPTPRSFARRRPDRACSTSNADLPTRDDLVTNCRTPRFARFVAQRSVDDLNGLGHLVAGHLVSDEFPDGHLVELHTVARLHQRIRHLAQVVVGHADHQARHDVGMCGQRSFDFRGIDVAATNGEHADTLVGEIQEAIGIEVTEVTQGIPAVPSLGFDADVAVRRAAARAGTHVDLADRARRAFVAIVVEDLHLPEHDHSN